MYNTYKIALILHKRMNNDLSNEEIEILQQWISMSSYNREIMHSIEKNNLPYEDILIMLEWNAEEDEVTFLENFQHSVFQKISNNDKINSSKFIRRTSKSKYLLVAMLLVFSALVIHLYHTYSDKGVNIEQLYRTKTSASLKLSNGEEIILDSTTNRILVDNDITYHDGRTVVNLDDVDDLEATIEVPKGGEYQLKLSDGTEVWLNSDSKLTYPLQFKKSKRKVNLLGEAYFKVAKSKSNHVDIPFVVTTNGQDIEVLGTEFNVKSYPEDGLTESTLIEGKVRVQAGGLDIDMLPGEQVRSVNNHVIKKSVDIEPYVAWKNNTFYFHETKLKDAIQILSRWYNFQFDEKTQFPDTHIYATISRNKGLSEVLKLMQSSGLSFQIVNHNGINKLIVNK